MSISEFIKGWMCAHTWMLHMSCDAVNLSIWSIQMRILVSCAKGDLEFYTTCGFYALDVCGLQGFGWYLKDGLFWSIP